MYQPLPLAISPSALRRMAKRYVRRKYGFRATAGEVVLDRIGWLEPIWHRGTSGTVAMRYQGTTIYVEVDRKAGVMQCTDTYQAQEFVPRIVGPLERQLSGVDSLVTARYGGLAFPGCYVGMGIRTFEDLVAQGGIEVCVSACGLDASNVCGLDLSHLGPSAKVGVFVWRSHRVVDAAYMPNDPMSVSDADTIYLSDYHRYRDGTWTHRAYEHIDCKSVSFAYPANLGIRVTPATVATEDEADANATSPWYELSTSGDQETRVMVFAHQREQGRQARMELIYPEVRGASTFAKNIPSYAGSQSRSPAIDDYPYHTFVWLNITSKKGYVLRGPVIVRIC